MQIKILIPFNGNTGGKSIHYEKGEVVDVPEGDADNFVRGNYAEYIKQDAPPAIKIVNKPKALNSKSIKGDK